MELTEASPQRSMINGACGAGTSIAAAYDRSGAGNHNALRLTNGAEHKFLTLTLMEINDAPFLRKYVNGN